MKYSVLNYGIQEVYEMAWNLCRHYLNGQLHFTLELSSQSHC